MDPMWEFVLKASAVIVPVFLAIVLTGVGYIIRMLGSLRDAVGKLEVSEASLRTKLDERSTAAARDHALIDRRLDEHDGLLDSHGQRIQRLEDWKVSTS